MINELIVLVVDKIVHANIILFYQLYFDKITQFY